MSMKSLLSVVALLGVAILSQADDKKGEQLVVYRSLKDGSRLVACGFASINPATKNLAWHVKDTTSDFNLNAAISRDGRWLTYGIIAENDQEGSGPEAIVHVKDLTTKEPPVSLGIKGMTSVLSPDGKQLVVNSESNADGGHRYWIVDVQTKQSQPLRLPDALASGKLSSRYYITDWSPDGKWLLATLSPEKGRKDFWIYRIRSDGTVAERIREGVAGRYSPDGRSILFGDVTVKSLFVAPLAGGEARQVSQEQNGLILGCAWSPDSKRIAYGWRKWSPEQLESGESFIMVVNADGTNPAVLFEAKTEFPDLIVAGWR
jgi:Tol biopolymer transport system component